MLTDLTGSGAVRNSIFDGMWRHVHTPNIFSPFRLLPGYLGHLNLGHLDLQCTLAVGSVLQREVSVHRMNRQQYGAIPVLVFHRGPQLCHAH